MWKESYRIGIDIIDSQHRELFRRADALLEAFRTHAGTQKYRETIAFLKEYVVVHFRDEEQYQESIRYAGINAHKKAHREFTANVLDFEKRLEASDYDIRVVKNLAGMLTAWLVYHVAGADQCIASGISEEQLMTGADFLDTFSHSIREVLDKLVGLSDLGETGFLCGDLQGDAFVKVELGGVCPGSLIFGFTRELAFRLVERLTFTTPDVMDEFVLSTLTELANIASGKAITTRAAEGVQCSFDPPVLLSSEDAGNVLELIPVHAGIAGMDIKYVPVA